MKYLYDFLLVCSTFRNFLSKHILPSTHMLAVCMQGEGETSALCMVFLGRLKILLGRWISGTFLLMAVGK